MDTHLRTVINAFIEDTCVLVAVAYLLARGRMLALLFAGRLPLWNAVKLGAVLGLVGLSEVEFPGARLPYSTHTLIVTFGVLAGGLRVGLVAAAVVTLGALILRPLPAAVAMSAAMLVVAVTTVVIRRFWRTPHQLSMGLVAGLLAQTAAVVTQWGLAGPLQTSYYPAEHLKTVLANGFGVMLLLLVVNDARLRADSERHRSEAERAHALVAEAQLRALRACVHPHFLFNTLTSIAALCLEAPVRAEAAVVRLGQLMRRMLEANPKSQLCLADEVEHVRGYLEIEQLRLAGRLCVIWNVDPTCEPILVPPFALQTLVENAIQHGIGLKMEPGEITVSIRRYPGRTLVAVRDDGVGMPAGSSRNALEPGLERMHGLQLLSQQLTLMYGRRARLRLFSRTDVGTLAAFAVPNQAAAVLPLDSGRT